MKSRGRWALYIAILLLIAVIFSYPLVRYFRHGMPYSFIPVGGQEITHQHPGDYIQLFYRFWLFSQALEGKIPFFSNPYEFSTPYTPPLFTTQGIPISIIFVLFMPLGNIFAYNALVLLSFVAAGVSLALLLREITGNTAAALLCGAVYACLPYRLGHLYGGHPGGFVFFLTPLALYFLERAWRLAGDAPGKSFLSGAVSGLCFFCSALTDLHTAFYLWGLLGAYAVVKIYDSASRSGVRAALRAARFPVLGLLAGSLPAALYLAWVKFFFLATSILREGRSLTIIGTFSPRPSDMLRLSPEAEKNVYPGLWVALLAAYGFFARRKEIGRGRTQRGPLICLWFWTGIFFLSYLISFGRSTEPFLPIYSWIHRVVPFIAYSRTPSRVVGVSFVCLFVLAAYGLRALLTGRRAAKIAACALVILALADYHPAGPTGISLLRESDSVYDEIREAKDTRRILELPIWPGDSAWSAIYEYYVTLTDVPMINGYNPAAKQAYVEKVFIPLKDLNCGEMRESQRDLLSAWGVRYIVLHQEAFPRKVSRYPFRLTLLNLINSPYLDLVRRDGPHILFSLRGRAKGAPQEFTRTSPIGKLYPACKMLHDVGTVIDDAAAASGRAICSTPGDGAGWLWQGHTRTYPTGHFRVFFNMRTDDISGRGPIARIEVYAPESGRVIAARDVTARDFERPHSYELQGLSFTNPRPTRVEFRACATGKGSICADFAYVLFEGEKDPRAEYEAEDLFHIGEWVEDSAASGGVAVRVGKDEDTFMPVVSGPSRLYPPGRYRARYRVKTADADPGEVFRLEVASAFGGGVAERGVTREEAEEGAGYRDYEIAFTLKKATPLSFLLRHKNRARLWVDRIEVLKKNSM